MIRPSISANSDFPVICQISRLEDIIRIVDMLLYIYAYCRTVDCGNDFENDPVQIFFCRRYHKNLFRADVNA